MSTRRSARLAAVKPEEKKRSSSQAEAKPPLRKRRRTKQSLQSGSDEDEQQPLLPAIPAHAESPRAEAEPNAANSSHVIVAVEQVREEARDVRERERDEAEQQREQQREKQREQREQASPERGLNERDFVAPTAPARMPQAQPQAQAQAAAPSEVQAAPSEVPAAATAATATAQAQIDGQLSDVDALTVHALDRAPRNGLSANANGTAKASENANAIVSVSANANANVSANENANANSNGIALKGGKVSGYISLSNSERDSMCYVQHFLTLEDFKAPPILSLITKPPDFPIPIAKIVDATDMNRVRCEMYHTTLIIGRTRSPGTGEVDLNILQNSVSKRHAIIKFVYDPHTDRHSFLLQNWGKNGTWVGGALFKSGSITVPLKNGSLIMAGQAQEDCVKIFTLQAGIQRAKQILLQRHQQQQQQLLLQQQQAALNQ
jgi:hypothetical protein